jgi:hypothetical protein
MPIVPWPLKMKLASVSDSDSPSLFFQGLLTHLYGSQWYLRKHFFSPVGLEHLPPKGRLEDQDWGGGLLSHKLMRNGEYDRLMLVHGILLPSNRTMQ